jgi:inhibitor of KinA
MTRDHCPKRLVNWSPLGETGVLIWTANEDAASELAAAVRSGSWPWLVDVVQAYASVAIYFERGAFAADERHARVITELSRLEESPISRTTPRSHRIPVCYEKQLDLDRVATHSGLTPDAVIALHSGSEYTVYAIGFCPGFPYLGYLPSAIANVPRLDSPRMRVPAGSVGLTGRQTGIYTEERPGGWNIMGQTPLELVNVVDGYFPLRTGDRLLFDRIDEATYEELRGERLMTMQS